MDPPTSSSLAEEKAPPAVFTARSARRGSRLRQPRLSTAGTRFPTLAAVFLGCSRIALVDEAECPYGVALLFQLGDTDIDLAAREIVDLQTIDDLIPAAGCGARK